MDLFINKPNSRVNIYLDQTWDNIYISAKTIHIDAILDVSQSVLGGIGGTGGTATNVGSIPNLTDSGEYGGSGSNGIGYSPGTGGAGGSSYVDSLSGEQGSTGTDALSTALPLYTYKAHSPRDSYLDAVIDIINSGSSGGGGGGGAAGNTYESTCRELLVGGSGGGGAAGGPGGGRIILLATDTITFGSQAQLISRGGVNGDNGSVGEFIWDEEANDAGVVTTRNIQTASINGTVAGPGGIGGSGVGGTSSGGEGGYGGLNYRESNVLVANRCAYTNALASLKKGGSGGNGGIGSGGSVYIQSYYDPTSNPLYLPSTIITTGGDTANPGVSAADHLNKYLTVTILPSTREAYAYFDTLSAFIYTDEAAWSSNTITRWTAQNGDLIFNTTTGQPIGSTDLLYKPLTAVGNTVTGETISMLISSTSDKVGLVDITPNVSVYPLVAGISSINALLSGNILQSLDTAVYEFSGSTGPVLYTSVNDTHTSSRSTSRTTNTFTSRNQFTYVNGISLNQSPSSDTLIVSAQLQSAITEIPSQTVVYSYIPGSGNLLSTYSTSSSVSAEFTRSFVSSLSTTVSSYSISHALSVCEYYDLSGIIAVENTTLSAIDLAQLISISIPLTATQAFNNYLVSIDPTARLNPDIIDNVFVVSDITAINNELVYITSHTPGSLLSAVYSYDPSILLNTYPMVSAILDTRTARVSVLMPDIITPKDDIIITGFQYLTAGGSYAGNLEVVNNIELSAAITYPAFMSVQPGSMSMQFHTITAEKHCYSTIELYDPFIYTPFNSLEYAITNNMQYIGYALLSSVWTVTGDDWYSLSNVQTWAPLSDTAQLQTIIGPISSTYIDNRAYRSSVHALVSAASIQRGVFRSPYTTTITHSITAIPSGSDKRYSDNIHTASSSRTITTNTSSIGTITVSPLTGTYGQETIVTLTYEISTAPGYALPEALLWTITLDHINTPALSNYMTAVAGLIHTISSINLSLSSATNGLPIDLIDVSQLSITVEGVFGGTVPTLYAQAGRYYPIVDVTSFEYNVSPLSGYLSATPYVFTGNVVLPQDSIQQTIPSIIQTITCMYMNNDGCPAVSSTIVPHVSNEAFYSNTTYYITEQASRYTEVSATLQYNNEIFTDVYNVHAYNWPTATDVALVTSSNIVSLSSGAYYLGGNLSLSALLTHDVLPYVAEIVASADSIVSMTVSNTSAISAYDTLDSYITSTDIIQINPQVHVYALLNSIDPAVSTQYRTAYTESGINIIKYNYPTLYYVPTEYRASRENIVFDTTITGITAGNVGIESVSSQSSAIYSTILVDQYNNGHDLPVYTVASFDNIVQALYDNSYYSISANVNGTLTGGTTSVVIEFTQTQAGSVSIPITATDGYNVYIASIEYTFDGVNFILPSMYFKNEMPVAYMGCKSTEPLTLIVWDDERRDSHTVVLYSRGSASIPYKDRDNRFSHLLPQWRFVDTNDNVIDSIDTTNTVISGDSQVIGVSGYAEVYYIDDMPTSSAGTLLVATLCALSFTSPLDTTNVVDLPGFSNSKLNAVTPYRINDLPPSHLNVTRDGLRDSRSYYWQKTKIPYTVTIASDLETCTTCDSILFNYPQLSSTNTPYTVLLDSLSSTIFYINSSFKSLDADNLPIPGFVRGTIQPLASGTSITIYSTASISVSGLNMYQPYIWVSNPENKTLNRIMYDANSIAGDYAACIGEHTSSTLLSADSLIIQTPYITGVNAILYEDVLNNAMYLSGFGGVFGLGIDACYNVWAADGELDTIYKYSALGELLTSVSVPFGSTPAGISIDRSNSVFVTLTDSVSTNKYTTLGHFVTSLLPDGFTTHADEDLGENELYAPGPVEVDTLGDIWVGYTNPLCSCVIKYDGNTYQEAIRIDLGAYIVPVDIIVDKYNHIYVLSQFDESYPAYETRHTNGWLTKYNTSGTLLSAISGLNNPHFMTIDTNNNIWITQGETMFSVLVGQSFTSYNAVNGVLESLPSTSNIESYAATLDEGDDTSIMGIAGTTDGNICIINSTENLVYIVKASDHTLQDTFKIYPDDNIAQYNDNNTYIVVDTWYKSAQAYGDWSGIRWYTKYLRSLETSTIELTGRSAAFNVLAAPTDIRLINDSYNMASAITNLFIPPHVNAEALPILHDEYLPAIIGTDASSYSTIGRQFYEKIANFTKNTVDIDTCNVDQLYSICKMLDIPIDSYDLSLPSELKRVIDIVSVHYNILRGHINTYNRNFGPAQCTTAAQYTTANNTSTTINRPHHRLSLTSIVSSGAGVVVYDELNKTYDLIYIYLSAGNTMPLSSISGYGLRSPVVINNGFNNYIFYEYISNLHRDEYIDNLIDWDNSRNTLSYNISSISEWYSEHGLVEQMIDYNIHNGLGFLS